jgi:hypothetical protein
MKFLGKVLFLAVGGVAAYTGYGYFRAGLHTRPKMPEGAFSLSFDNGRRVILEGVEDERLERRYMARSYKDLPTYFDGAWSFCHPPTDAEAERITASTSLDRGMRLDALCALDADGDIIETAIIVSVPRL